MAIVGALVLGDEARGQVGAESDREVLEAFYHATGGPDWFASTNWLSDEPLSEWYGVVRPSTTRITGGSHLPARLTAPDDKPTEEAT